MPELPEVETVVLGLRSLLPGHKFVRVEFDWSKSFPNTQADVEKFLFGSDVIDVRRRGKAILIDLSSDYTLVIHLKMTGQLVYRGESDFGGGHPSDSLVDKLPDKSTRVEFEFENGHKLFFNDQRKFGWVRLLPTLEVGEINFMKNLGPDALTVTDTEFVKRFKSRHKSIKACLLDQTILAGCGNIYADEALWASQIHPKTTASKLTDKQLAELHRCLQQVLKLSISLGGSSSKNYVNAQGERGSYLTFANAYGRDGLPCNRCGQEMTKMVVAGRGTHVCQGCQRVKK
ncbi:bifunctional DNA-formamidopyrimidine glycosylase/DNA-(apurinic or apyrimidinic site) lyase [Candidatus Saccharibacteria bacterium]|nr:bifunctional DNA-formamidopyrimidine glycosylase/DNA-(apurinic or apyrimidinic site) lyase [Candidatus Saccharibacteria bacterium]MCB9821193.1 bifunctional DNA-formamidopyrimidine glycosylase/DNA-(apurinic or apyrimidinic site) lyase [Candidatus Nomurabacteria bacterium]